MVERCTDAVNGATACDGVELIEGELRGPVWGEAFGKSMQ